MVVVEIGEGDAVGRGECVPYKRYGESVAGVVARIESLAPTLRHGMDRDALASALPPGAARNAVDCALWDLEAKRSGVPAWRRAGVSPPRELTTSVTLSLAAPEEMATAARALAKWPWLKVKLGPDGALARVRAVHAAAPGARLIVDANEAWSPEILANLGPELATLGVTLIEQPLAAGDDAPLADLDLPVPVCADESCHDTASLAELAGRYDVVNIKLDKTGGLTEALRLARAARAAGFGVMVGCTVGTSLAMAPATLIAADFVDLDGPLLLARDRPHGITYRHATMAPPSPRLWG